MAVERWIERVDGELRRRFKLAGRGSIARVQRALGLGRGYYRDQRRPEREFYSLDVLLRTLEQLGVSAADFFTAALGPGDPVADFRAEAADLRLERRGKRAPRILGIEAQRPPGGAASPPEVDLEALDAERDNDPREVMRRIKLLMPRIEDRRVPELLAIYASACRGIGKLDEAHLILDRALELAGEVGDEGVLATVLRRCEALVADRGEYVRALVLLERAVFLSVRSGDRIGIGLGLLKMGMNYGCLERPEQAIVSLRAALGYLPANRPSLTRHRFGCLVNLSIAFRKRRDLDAAKHFAEEALQFSEDVSIAALGKLVWLQGSMAKQRGDHTQAEKHFQKAFEIHRQFSPVSAALLAVELARMQVLRGDQAAAKATAKATATLLKPLEKNEIASAAVLELVRCSLAGQGMSMPVLQRIGRKLMASRARRSGHARR